MSYLKKERKLVGRVGGWCGEVRQFLLCFTQCSSLWHSCFWLGCSILLVCSRVAKVFRLSGKNFKRAHELSESCRICEYFMRKARLKRKRNVGQASTYGLIGIKVLLVVSWVLSKWDSCRANQPGYSIFIRKYIAIPFATNILWEQQKRSNYRYFLESCHR